MSSISFLADEENHYRAEYLRAIAPRDFNKYERKIL